MTVESGLLERRVQKIPVSKIQGIKIKQHVVRKLLRLSTVELILAGDQQKEGDTGGGKLYFLPIINDRELFQVLDFLLPDWDFNEPEIQYVSRQRLFYFWRWIVLILVPATFVGFYFQFWSGLILLAIFGYLLLINWLDCNYQGYALQSANRVCVQNFTGLSKVQTFVERPKIQAFKESSSIWLIKKAIGRITFYVKDGSGDLSLSLRFMNFNHLTNLKHFFLGSNESL